MKFLLTLSLLICLLASCTKSETDLQTTCFKGRYIGQGCWPVIQLLEPLDGSLPTAQYSTYKHAFGTGDIPEQYKDGRTFYFTVTGIDSNVIYQTYCSPTKYIVGIGSFSDVAYRDTTK